MTAGLPEKAPTAKAAVNAELAMRPQVIGQRLFTAGLPRPVHQDERSQFVLVDGERVDGVWLVPEEDQADTPIIVEL